MTVREQKTLLQGLHLWRHADTRATIPLTLETLADLNTRPWPRYGTAPEQPA